MYTEPWKEIMFEDFLKKLDDIYDLSNTNDTYDLKNKIKSMIETFHELIGYDMVYFYCKKCDIAIRDVIFEQKCCYHCPICQDYKNIRLVTESEINAINRIPLNKRLKENEWNEKKCIVCGKPAECRSINVITGGEEYYCISHIKDCRNDINIDKEA